MGLLDSLRAKYDLYRLEQRYTRREKRTTFTSGAQYVDGEYVYTSSAPATPSDTSATSSRSCGSTGSSGGGSWSGKARRPSGRVAEVFARKRLSRVC